MAKPYSNDLRARVIVAVEEGAMLEEAAERHHVSLSSVGQFLRRKRETGNVNPAKFGGYKPYVLAAHEESQTMEDHGAFLPFPQRSSILPTTTTNSSPNFPRAGRNPCEN